MSEATFGRYELKYFLPFDKISELIQWSTPYLVPDIHAQPGSQARPHYLVQSVYFDSTTLRLYKEKIDGMRNRSKFRVRSYDPVPGPEAPVFVEIKNRRDTQVIKERVALPLAHVANVLFNGLRLDALALNSYQRKPLERFLYYYQTADLAPIVTVIYDRVPFTCREDKQV
ncbi:MAG: VTC domain-containing protein, partial [bacterium]|nr:VTC domain-containing protein [bacterium]